MKVRCFLAWVTMVIFHATLRKSKEVCREIIALFSNKKGVEAPLQKVFKIRCKVFNSRPKISARASSWDKNGWIHDRLFLHALPKKNSIKSYNNTSSLSFMNTTGTHVWLYKRSQIFSQENTFSLLLLRFKNRKTFYFIKTLQFK